MPDFESLWSALESRREHLTRTVLSKAPEQQQQPAVRGAFSPAETLEHMALTEKYYLPMFDKANRSKLGTKPPRRGYFFRVAVNRMRNAGPMPTMGAMTPKGQVDVDAAAGHWESVRGELRTRLQGLPVDQAVFRHPFFGRLSPELIIELFDAHTEYHAKRI